MAALDVLLGRARGPMGPRVEIDFGLDGAWAALGDVLGRLNGFFVFNAGVQVFRAGDEGLGPDLMSWNAPERWKYAYDGLADDLFCFGQDILGVQFAIDADGTLVTFDPETGDRERLGSSLDDWATWLLEDPNVHGAQGISTAWQDRNGALSPDQRLIPKVFFVAGGDFDLPNLIARDAATAMRIRGPIAQQVHAVPDGGQITISVPAPGPGRATDG